MQTPCKIFFSKHIKPENQFKIVLSNLIFHFQKQTLRRNYGPSTSIYILEKLIRNYEIKEGDFCHSVQKMIFN